MQPKTYQLQYMWTSFQQQIFCPYNCLLKDLNPKKKFGFLDPVTQNHCNNLVVPKYCVNILSYFQTSFAIPEAQRRHYSLYFFFYAVSEALRRYYGLYFFFSIAFAILQVLETRRRHYGLYFFFWIAFAVLQVLETRRRHHGLYFFLQAFCVTPEKWKHYVPCFQIFSVKNESL